MKPPYRKLQNKVIEKLLGLYFGIIVATVVLVKVSNYIEPFIPEIIIATVLVISAHIWIRRRRNRW